MMPGLPERRSHDYIRVGTTTLLAAQEVATGMMILSLHQRHRAVAFRKSSLRLSSRSCRAVPVGREEHVRGHRQGPGDQPGDAAELGAGRAGPQGPRGGHQRLATGGTDCRGSLRRRFVIWSRAGVWGWLHEAVLHGSMTSASSTSPVSFSTPPT